MSIILGEIALAIVVLVALPVMIVSAYRMTFPLSRRKDAETARLNQKAAQGEGGTVSISSTTAYKKETDADVLGKLYQQLTSKTALMLVALVTIIVIGYWWLMPAMQTAKMVYVGKMPAWGWDVVIVVAIFGVLWILKAKDAAAWTAAVLGVGILLALHIMPFVESSDSHKSDIPLASESEIKDRPTLTLAPGGKSRKLPVPLGKGFTFTGEDVVIHCVYRNSHEVSFKIGEGTCPGGDMPFVYVSNLRKTEENVVSYAYHN